MIGHFKAMCRLSLLLVSIMILLITNLSTNVFAQDESAAEHYRIEASVDLDTPYVGQQVVYSLRFYAQRIPPDYDYIAPDFAGWWRGEQIVTESAAMLDGVAYTVRTFETLIYPLQAALLTISPARLLIPETVFSDRSELTTGTVNVAVQPLPEGAPPSFTGGVGRFNISADTETTTITLGQPLTLRWTVTGAGNLAQIGQPNLTLPSGWRIYVDPTTTTSITRGAGERIFEWRLMAEQAGTLTLPAQAFAYFDPESRQYMTLDVPEIVIDVLPDASGRRELPAARRSDTRPAALPLKAVTQFQTDAPLTVPLWAWALAPLIVVATAGGQSLRRRTRIRREYLRREQALTQAKTLLQRASRSDDAEAFSLVHEAISRYFADKSNSDLQRLTYSEIQAVLVGYQIDAEMREGLALCWLEAEAARYAPAGAVDLNRLLRRTAGVLTEIDQQWNTRATEGAASEQG